MLKVHLLFATAILLFASLASADTVVLRDGTSYLGRLQGGAITFADTQGVKYECSWGGRNAVEFTRSPVQSM